MELSSPTGYHCAVASTADERARQGRLDQGLRASWQRDGFFRVPGFAPPDVTQRMLGRAVEIARACGGPGAWRGFLVTPESNLGGHPDLPEKGVSKIFRLHRDESFRDFLDDPALATLLEGLLGPDLDCFLSQFIFKHPGAWGQPWHQDAFYFPFDRGPQVGVWLAITEARRDNGCLWVLPGSHREPLHEHRPDARPNANYGYVEIVDHDMEGAVPVPMCPGDLLVFHSHLMHRSFDNEARDLRAALVYHFAVAGTVDRAKTPTPVNDWLPLRREGRPVAPQGEGSR